MWKLGLWPRNSFSGNICFEFSVLALCSVSIGRAKPAANKIDVQCPLSTQASSPVHLHYNMIISQGVPHCKDQIPKFWNKYSQKRNFGVSVPISTCMRLWAIYIFPWSVSLLCWRKYVDRSWDYINRSQTHECGNWGWGHAIPRKGKHKGDFRCCAV
jgi:hypothetical protein